MIRSFVLVLIGVLAMAAGFAGDATAEGWTPRPIVTQGKGDSCVEPTEVMRRRHGEILLSAAEKGVSADAGTERHGLSDCVECHAARDGGGRVLPVDGDDQFCGSCHRFAAVSTNCFACHADRPEAKPARIDAPVSTADHTSFEELKKPFKTGPEVTRACLSCHTEAGKQLHQTTHWRWRFDNPRTGRELGKLNTINMFWGAVVSNHARCTSCHIGYGWKDDGFDFTAEENIDCLVCHDTTGTYKKFPTDAGHPPYVDKPFPEDGGRMWKAPDLGQVAQKVGKTSRETCGACHFYGGGGDGVKHGDLDSSLVAATRALDVHMGKDGLDLSCADCHVSQGHRFSGSRYATTAKDTHGIDVPGRDDGSRATCESCHGNEPHRTNPHRPAVYEKLNGHVDKVACQTCHIPAFARGGVATKTRVDWSTAGRLGTDGRPIRTKNEKGRETYATDRGKSTWGENLVPEYAWFNGTVRYKLIGDKLGGEEPVALNRYEGEAGDPGARIWPFKVMRGRQPIDAGNGTLAAFKLYGGDAAFGPSRDWDRAIGAAMDEAGVDFSGRNGFVETTMDWPVTHMVAPREQALDCGACHSREGRLEGLEAPYMPGRDRSGLVDLLGWLAVLAAIGGVAVHGAARLVLSRRQRNA